MRNLCREIGISNATFYNLKAKYGGLSARDLKRLNVLDDYNRQVLRIEADTCLPARRVIRVLEQLEESRCLPSKTRMDNGPYFISQTLDT